MKKIYNSIKEILSEANSKQATPKYTTQQYVDWAKKYSEKHGVPYSMVLHSMHKETGKIGDPEKMRIARSNRGATGVMQIMPKYAEKGPYQIKPSDLTDPEKNIEAGVRGLSYFYNKYKDPQKAMAAYNAGEGGARNYLKSGDPKTIKTRQTRDYISDYKDDVEHQLSKFFPKADKMASSSKPSSKPEKLEVKQEPEVVKKAEVKQPYPVEPPKQVEKASGAMENPYTPGTRDYAFKQARIEGKKEFTDPATGQRIAVKLKENSQVKESNMKNIYESIKNILEVKSTHGVRGLETYTQFKPGEGPTTDLSKTTLSKEGKYYVYDPNLKKNVPVKPKATSADAEMVAKNLMQQGPKKTLQASNPKINVTPEIKAEKQSVKKELSPFEKEFARARANKEPTFTWHDKQGRPYQVATKLKGEEEPPKVKAAAPVKTARISSGETKRGETKTRSVEVSDDEMKDIDKQKDSQKKNIKFDMEKERERVKNDITNIESKPAEKTDDEKKSDELWGDIRKELENETPEDKKARDERIKQYKKEWGMKDQTNEGKQMSINKKFNVSDALYSSVMEVMTKSSGGTVPKNEKQKKLAAMHGDPNMITHGDVLKARGVKMKEEIEQVDELSTKTLSSYVKKRGAQLRGGYEDSEKVKGINAALRKIKQNSVKEEADQVDEMSSKMKMKLGLYGKKKKTNEDVEQVDELSRGKLVGYIEKASKTKGAEAIARVAGIKKAAQKLKDIKKQSMQSEDVEQVDEISKGTLGSYISKSADKAREHGFYGGVAFTKGKLDQSDYHAKKELKRTRGLNKAVSRLTKEEVLDEAKKLISKHGEDQPISAKVYKDTEWNEYQVHYFKNGKHMGEGPVSYHGDDKEDAQNTAEHEVKRMNKSKGNADSIIAAAKKRAAGEHAMEERIVGEQTATYMPPAGHRVRMTTPPAGSSEKSSVQYVKKDSEIKQASQADSEKAKKDQNVKEDWVDSKGKFHKEAPPPGQVPSPDEGYRPKKPGKKTQPGSTPKAMDMEESTDTPGNSYEHQCAIHVKSESFGEGRTITTQHADPDEYGNIAWYDVMFEHGIEKYVPTNELEILVSESHMHSKRKKKVAEETGEERKAKLERDEDRFKAAEAGNYQGRNARGDVIKSGGEVVKGNPNPPSMMDRIKGKLGIPNTATDALGEPMYKSSRPTSGSGPRGGGGAGVGMMDPGAIKNLKKMY